MFRSFLLVVPSKAKRETFGIGNKRWTAYGYYLCKMQLHVFESRSLLWVLRFLLLNIKYLTEFHSFTIDELYSKKFISFMNFKRISFFWKIGIILLILCIVILAPKAMYIEASAIMLCNSFLMDKIIFYGRWTKC